MMQPLGRKPSRFPTKVDYHPRKGYINWWENEMSTNDNKAAEKRECKEAIQKALDEEASEPKEYPNLHSASLEKLLIRLIKEEEENENKR